MTVLLGMLAGCAERLPQAPQEFNTADIETVEWMTFEQQQAIKVQVLEQFGLADNPIAAMAADNAWRAALLTKADKKFGTSEAAREYLADWPEFAGWQPKAKPAADPEPEPAPLPELEELPPKPRLPLMIGQFQKITADEQEAAIGFVESYLPTRYNGEKFYFQKWTIIRDELGGMLLSSEVIARGGNFFAQLRVTRHRGEFALITYNGRGHRTVTDANMMRLYNRGDFLEYQRLEELQRYQKGVIPYTEALSRNIKRLEAAPEGKTRQYVATTQGRVQPSDG
ncbi:MAG: hypothetical protein NXI04_22180 [Planctomycetaceae bacterium]|nr:hypothetical protein [Planctomycetaceae bacterium]